MELKRVVVTGLGAITPVGNSIAEMWENICNGVSGAGPITHFDASAFKTQFACEVKNFSAAEFGIDRKEARKMDIYTQYAIAAAKQAIDDSQMNLEVIDKNRVGVVFGVMAESIDIGIVEVFGFGNLQHLVAFSGVEEFALLVEEFEGVPMTGVVAGGDDDAATGAFHRYRNFGGGG